MSTNSTPAVYDYQVGGYQLPSYTATYCSDCGKPGTHRLTVNRVERYGVLLSDSYLDYCGEHIDEATNKARKMCQARLYGTNDGQSGQSKGAA